MTRKLLIISALCLLAAFTSCKKAPLTVGPTVFQVRELPDFTEVHVNDYINLSLVRSDTCYFEIKTGKNIIDNITTEIRDGVLTICNTTTCNWIHQYNYECDATLYFKDITNFIFASSGTLVTKNSYTGELPSGDFYRFEIHDGSGDIDLNINNCNDLRVIYHRGTSRLDLHGSNNHNFSIYKRSYGIIDARNYDAETVCVTAESPSDCFISASGYIEAVINDLGNIYYKGEPDSISVTYGKYARGRLIPLY
jgi:hypothetical protein